jgi:hypothetical protein
VFHYDVMNEDQEELLTVQAFAKRSGVCDATVRKWAYARIIPCIKLRYLVRIPFRRAMKALEARTEKELESLQDA